SLLDEPDRLGVGAKAPPCRFSPGAAASLRPAPPRTPQPPCRRGHAARRGRAGDGGSPCARGGRPGPSRVPDTPCRKKERARALERFTIRFAVAEFARIQAWLARPEFWRIQLQHTYP